MTVDFAKEYLLDDCEDCPENENGECTTQSHCFEVKRMAIQALEQTRWIPVSERLPDINDEVLVTYIVNGNTKKRYVETASYYAGLDEWTSYYDEYRVAGTKVEIVAWMPLPQPYKAESEDKE